MNAKKKQLLALRRGPDGIIGPPAWYRQRLAELRALPPPTLEQVRRTAEQCGQVAVATPEERRKILSRLSRTERLVLELRHFGTAAHSSKRWMIFAHHEPAH